MQTTDKLHSLIILSRKKIINKQVSRLFLDGICLKSIIITHMQITQTGLLTLHPCAHINLATKYMRLSVRLIVESLVNKPAGIVPTQITKVIFEPRLSSAAKSGFYAGTSAEN